MSKTKDFFKSFFVFYIKVAIIHSATYIFYGILFSSLFDYSNLYSTPIVSSFMRNFDSPFIIAGPFLQPVRALVFAAVLYPLRDFLRTKKLGWLILFGLFLGIGIIAPPSAAPSSIEGLIYTQLPLAFHLKGLPEIILQTLTFSFLLWVTEAVPLKQKDFLISGFIFKFLKSLIIAIVGVIAFSMAGIVVFKYLDIDYTQAKLERSSISILTAISLLSMIVSYFLGERAYKKPLFHLIINPLYIAVYTALPYLLNIYFNNVYSNVEFALLPTSLVSIVVCISSYFIFGRVYKEKSKPDNKKTDTGDSDIDDYIDIDSDIDNDKNINENITEEDNNEENK